MRLALAVLMIASAFVGGCSRAQTYAAEPRLAPRMYGQGQHLPQPDTHSQMQTQPLRRPAVTTLPTLATSRRHAVTRHAIAHWSQCRARTRSPAI